MAISKHIIDRQRDAHVEGFNGETVVNTIQLPDRILTQKTEIVNSTLSYTGYSLLEDADTSASVWRISRTTVIGSETTTEFVSGGKFDQIWDDRDSLFPTAPFTNQYSVQLDGINDKVNFGPNFDYDVGTQWSFSLWFKANNLAARQTLYSKTTNDGNVYGWGVYLETSGKIFVQVRGPGALKSYTFGIVLSSGVWNHIVFSYAGGSNMNQIKLFLNGVQDTVPPSSGLTSLLYAQEAIVGSRNTTFPLSGYVEEFSVWNTALGLSEASQIYNGGIPTDLLVSPLAGNLVNYYRMGDGDSAPDVFDKKGVVNGLLQNGASFALEVP